MDAASTLNLHSGNKLPVMGLGSWQLTGQTCIEAVRMALEMGYRMVDTSGDYHNQGEVGEGIRQSGLPRQDIYLVTKVEEDDDAYEATRRNLDELGMDYADLMLIHRPPKQGVGEELWAGLIRAKDEGLCRDIGVSNYSVEQIEELTDASHEAPVVNQIEWTPFGHSREMLQYCRDNDIIIQAYSPLARSERLADPAIQDLAESHGKTPAQILIRWDIQLKAVPIIKASTEEHLRQNLDVFDFELSAEDMQRLDGLNQDYSALPAMNKPMYI